MAESRRQNLLTHLLLDTSLDTPPSRCIRKIYLEGGVGLYLDSATQLLLDTAFSRFWQLLVDSATRLLLDTF